MIKSEQDGLNFGTSGMPVSAVPPAGGQTAPAQPDLDEQDQSKDAFFVQVGEIAEAMIARHGNEFAIGTLVLAAKFIAEGRPLISRATKTGVAKPL